MILVDARILIYAAMRVLLQLEPASNWLNQQLTWSSRVGLPWPSLLGFLRVVTNPRVFANPPSTREAWARVTAWLGCDTVWTPHPMDRHPELFGQLLSLPGVRANLVHDAHLAALAMEHGLILCSTDGDFPGCGGKIRSARRNHRALTSSARVSAHRKNGNRCRRR